MTFLLTELSKDQIQKSSITGELLVSGVGENPLISNVQIANSTYDILEDQTGISLYGGYIIINGQNFKSNAKVFVGNTEAILVNVVSSNVITAELPTIVNVLTSSGSSANIDFYRNVYVQDIDTGVLAIGVNKTRYKLEVNHGWTGHGSGASILVRSDMYNDTSIALSRTPVSGSRYSLAGTSNDNYGWFGGGFIGLGGGTRCDRIDFKNDTTDLFRGFIFGTHTIESAATGNQNFGWWAGRISPAVTTVVRLDFSADTTTSTRGPISVARGGMSASSNDDYGWFAGGREGPNNVVDRINFASDTVTASARGTLSSGRTNGGATGNDDFGYHGGGFVRPAPTVRITYATDTATTVTKTSAYGAEYIGAYSNKKDFGYFCGGTTPGATFSSINRFSFINDTEALVNVGPLVGARHSHASFSGIT